MHFLPADNFKVMPWKNGGGFTREVMLCGDPRSFDWRISIATVDASGPFSCFPGVDRTIAVLQGAGLRLNVDGKKVNISQTCKPFSFSGEAAVHAECIDGETTDLNVMTRRATFTHEMKILRLTERFMCSELPGRSFLIFNGVFDVTINTVTHKARPLDVVCGIGEAKYLEIIPLEPSDIFQITIRDNAP